jgi:RHS repeat-associated protein
MVHGAGIGSFTNRWTREFAYGANNNRLASSTVGPTTINYTYDVHGNMDQMPHLPDINWDFDNHLRSVDLRGGGTAYYTYDADGNRVRKVIERQGRIAEERLYVGRLEVFTRTQPGVTQLRRETLHVMDDTRRIAMVDTRTAGSDSSLPELIRYQFNNHLGTALLELDDNAAIISYEEYYPFGSTSYQAVDSLREVPTKRYRYTGKERDEESGFYYHGVRYYAPWLARWTAPDPIGIKDGINRYVYSGNRPIGSSDPTGMWEWPSWRTVAIVTAVVVVGAVVTVATAGAAGPLIAGAVATAGLTGTAATVATGVAVGAVAGAVGGAAAGAVGEGTRQVVHNRTLGLGTESFSAGRIVRAAGRGAVEGAIVGAAVGGVAALATTAVGGAAVAAVGRVGQRVLPAVVRQGATAVARGTVSAARSVARAPVIRQSLQGLQGIHGAAERVGVRVARGVFQSSGRGAGAVEVYASSGRISATFGADRPGLSRGRVHIDIGGEGAHPEAINLNPTNVTSTNEATLIPRRVPGVGERLPFSSRTADVITLEGAPLRPGAAEEIGRVIRPGGEVTLVNPSDYATAAHQRVADVLRGNVTQTVTNDITTTVIRVPAR